jgi:pimeloyl-ACP methyl ester carboxylesterase
LWRRRRRLPRALGVEPIEIPGGHFPMVEDPAALADLLDWLAREPVGSPDPE